MDTQTQLITIKDCIVERKANEVSVTTYTDARPTEEELKTQVMRLRNSFGNVNEGFLAELFYAFIDCRYTASQVRDMITYVIRNHKYERVKISDVLNTPNGIVKLYSGRMFNTRPTEEVMAEYYPITKIDGVIYLARKEDVNALSETQKIVLRKLYTEAFGKNGG